MYETYIFNENGGLRHEEARKVDEAEIAAARTHQAQPDRCR
jgi:hypothetical protein